VINVDMDKNPAYPKAVSKLKKKGTVSPDCELRPVKGCVARMGKGW